MKESKVHELIEILDKKLIQNKHAKEGTITLRNKDDMMVFIEKINNNYILEEVDLSSRSICYIELNREELQSFLKNLKGFR